MFKSLALAKDAKWNGEPLSFKRFCDTFQERLLENGVYGYFDGSTQEPSRPDVALLAAREMRATQAQLKDIRDYEALDRRYREKCELVMSTLLGMLGPVPKQQISRFLSMPNITVIQKAIMAFDDLKRVFAGANIYNKIKIQQAMGNIPTARIKDISNYHWHTSRTRPLVI